MELLLAFGLLGLVLLRGLLPMIAVRERLGTLLAADATTLAPASLANQMQLIIAPFVPNENLTASSLTFGTTNGLGPIACATGAQESALDPVTGAQIITIVPGAGSGFRWVSSGTFTSPITVYGIALTDSTGATLLGVAQFATPYIMQAAGYQIDADPAQITFVLQPMS
jgi:hypothetical protein